MTDTVRGPLLTTGPVEVKLRESQRTLATLMDNLPGMAYRCRNDSQWTMDFVSHGSMSLTGYAPAELIANATISYADLIVPEDRERVDHDVQAALAARRTFQIVYCIAPKAGARKWVWEQGCGVFSTTGALIALEGFITDITEARHAQDGLRDSEARYRLLTEAAFEGVFIHDKGVMIEGNPALGRIFGYELNEMVGRNMMDFIPTAESRERIARHMATDSHERYEVHASHSSGALMTAIITGRNTTYRGKAARVTTVQDITDLKRTELELRGRETQLLEAQAIAHLGSWDWNIAAAEMTASVELRRIYGFAAAEVLSPAMIFDRIHPDDAQKVQETVDAAMQGGSHFSLDHRIVHPSGQVRHFHVEGRVVRDDAGTPLHLIGAGQDVTDRHEAEIVARALIHEQAARASSEAAERRADFLAEASRLLGSSFDYQATMAMLMKLVVPRLADFATFDVIAPDGAVNRLAVAHVVAEKEAFLWDLQRWLHVAGPIMRQLGGPLFDGKPMFLAEVTDAALESLAMDEEHGRLLRQISPRSAMTVPLMAGGKLAGALALYTSESGRQFDANDLALAEELARRASLAVENARLFQAAESATRARDQMLGVVAHDLRNPLGTIRMAAGLLEEVLEAESPARKQLAMVNRAVGRMNRLIGDLLDMKRLENGPLSIEMRPCPAGAVLAEAVDMLRALAGESGVQLMLGELRALPTVMADPNRIQQVLSNLIGNAIKFTPKGGSITVGGAHESEFVRMTVADTGNGIHPEQLPHVFNQFWQGSKTDKRGIGLGLSIAKGIVEAHGGRIWVQSTPGTGTSFHFTIPAVGPLMFAEPAGSRSQLRS